MTDRDGTPAGDEFDGRIDENLAEVDDPSGEELERAERRGMGRGAALALGAAAFLVLIAVALLMIFNPFGRSPAPDNTAPVTTLPALTVGPTESLPLATSPAPPSVTATPSTDVSSTPTAADRPIALNRWNWLPGQQAFSVGGFIDGVESGGTCTLTAVNGATTYSGSAPATTGASTTVCVVNVGAPGAPAGEYQLTMSYVGAGGNASSQPVVVTVP